MKFYPSSSSESVVDFIYQRLSRSLAAGNRVLWLLSGGSAINIEVEIAERLIGQAGLENLTVGLIDERYGPAGHADSNEQQLLHAGFRLEPDKFMGVLKDKGMAQTANDYESRLRQCLEEADYCLAVAGIGADGHTLGIKPNSPALNSANLVEAYDWDDYKRITTTSKLIKQLDEVVVYAFGPEKIEQLQRLNDDAAPADQPAQLLKLCPNLAIFTDQPLSFK